jgi:hypothetical protein
VRSIKHFAAEAPIPRHPSPSCDTELLRTADLRFLAVCFAETTQSFVPSIIFTFPPTGAGPQAFRSTLAIFSSDNIEIDMSC